MMRHSITSLQNPKIKALIKLRQRRQRNQQQLMLIDGVRAIRLALQNDFPLTSIYFIEAEATETIITATLRSDAQAAGIPLQPVTESVFQKIGYGDHPDGWLALAPQPRFTLADLPTPPNLLYLVLEGVEKPGNLGAVLRSADAAGLTGLLLCDTQTDVYNPNVIHASRGAFFTLPLAQASVPETITFLQTHQIQILAATPQEPSQLYTQFDLRQPTAFVLGAEHVGLTKAWLSHTLIRLPMLGQVDSLNVAQTASILMYEALRQRGFE